MSKVRTNDGYKDIEAIYAGNIPIDTIYDKNGNMLFSAYNEVNGISPLSFKSKTNNSSTLKNYRIYGNTISGESVGDRTANLAPNLGRWIDGYLKQSDGTLMNVTSAKEKTSPFIEVNSNDEFTFSYDIGSNEKWAAVAFYDENKNFIFRSVQYTVIPFTFIVNIENAKFIRLSCNTFDSEIYPNLNSGSTALPYEPYGYKVPVKIEGKNLLQNTATTQTLGADDTHPGITFTVNNDGSIIVNGSSGSTQTFKWEMDSIPVGTQIILSGCPSGGGNNKHKLDIRNASLQALAADSGNGATYTITGAEKYVLIRVAADYVCDNLTFYPMIRRAEIADGTYEPYHAPTTTNIYLPEQIKKVGSEYEYIDYAEQKQYFADGTSVSVALPAISTFVGINSFDVETNVIPSSVSIYGKIKSEMTTYMESITPDASIGKVIFVTKSYIPKSGQNLYAGILARTVAEGTEFDGILDSSHYDYLRGTSDPEMKRYRCTWRKTYVQGEKYYARAYCKYLDKNNEQIECYGHIYSADMNGFEMSDVYTITYKSQDGQTTLYTETVIQGKNGTYNTTPTKSSTAQYDYTFAGWSTSTDSTTATHGATQDIQSNKVVYAAFAETARTYTVTFYNGETQLGTSSVIYGYDATYSGVTPIKTSTAQYKYRFLGWNTDSTASTADNNALLNITSDRTVYAIFEQTTMIYTVYFYNESTLLETVQNVPYGGTATYTGSTPTKTNYTFTGWSPEPTNISGDTSCYAQFEAAIQGLITDSWETIATRAAAGTAQNYYSVGDCKAVTLNGTCGTLELNNVTLYVYILGFDHNSALEGTGITFGGFKTNHDSLGKDICLIDSHYKSTNTTGLKWFNMSHRQGSSQYGHNYGGWKGSDMRYDILGSTDTAPSGYGATATTSNVGYDASSTCATNPVANTLMSCLPSDLRAVMKPMTKYTDNVGNKSNINGNVTASVDYLPLLAEYEIFGARTYANQYEQNKQAQYAYYADSNNSKVKYRHSSTGSTAIWWGRSPHYAGNQTFCDVSSDGSANTGAARYSYGVAPIFLVGL